MTQVEKSIEIWPNTASHTLQGRSIATAIASPQLV